MDGGNLYGDDSGVREDDTFVAGQNTTIEDFDLSPDGAGLSGRSNQVNDIVFVQVTAASLAAAGYTLQRFMSWLVVMRVLVRISGVILFVIWRLRLLMIRQRAIVTMRFV